jgi:hypothetical protein
VKEPGGKLASTRDEGQFRSLRVWGNMREVGLEGPASRLSGNPCLCTPPAGTRRSSIVTKVGIAKDREVARQRSF